MATNLYTEIEADLRLRGDYLKVDGTLEVDGAATLDEGLTLSAPAVTATKTLTVASLMTTHTGVTVGAPTGTLAGAVWTSDAPALTAGQKFIVLTMGSTDYRIPIWDNA